jgi:ribosomal protein S18 acetylase RimI-like enzyme
LLYLRHWLDGPSAEGSARVPARITPLRYEPYSDANRSVFHETLLRTYELTLDCPELNGIRTVEEIIEGHKAQGVFRPERWWLALEEGRPVGVLMLTEVTDWEGWDVEYLGVVPEARGRGVGRLLTVKAIGEARAGGASRLTLAVDRRNVPAWNLYRSLGFEESDQRDVFLVVL